MSKQSNNPTIQQSKIMCLIIHNPKNKSIPAEIVENALHLNPDGFGIFFHDSGEIIHSMSFDESFDLMSENRSFTAHFRYATSGKIGITSCHPFAIPDTSFSLMMNGTIDRLKSSRKVDTNELCKIMAGMSESQIIGVLSTHPCRFALLDRITGRAIAINRDLWTKRDGVLYSKANCFPVIKSSRFPKLDDWDLLDEDEWNCTFIPWEEEEEIEEIPSAANVAVYGTLKAGRGNHGFLSQSRFLGRAVTKSARPLVIDGLPYLIDRPGFGCNVDVEVYRVDKSTLLRLDGLEGHPNWYRRKQIPVIMAGGDEVTAWAYMIPDSTSGDIMSDSGKYHSNY
jgi:gamma-glutamylcyclotransferase (GGCT)/AIG2-like uncharacterized protein YtfP